MENNGDKPKYIIKNHHEAIIDVTSYDQVQALIIADKKQPSKSSGEINPYKNFIYSLHHDSYLHTKVKQPTNPAYNLLENEYKRKPGTGRIYSKTATHVIRKATIALARKFCDLEDTFNKQVDDRLNKRPIENKLKALGEKIRKYKHDYVAINKKEILEPADRALLMELEDIIIKHSIEYVTYEDEALLPIKESVSRIKQIKKLITSIELPMVDLPIETIKQIFDKIVIVDQENYVFVINTSDTPLQKETLKKVAEMNPLLESKCKGVEFVNWKIITY